MENLNDHMDDLPELEPLAPGEELPLTQAPRQENVKVKMAETFAQANAEKGRKQLVAENLLSMLPELLILVFFSVLGTYVAVSVTSLPLITALFPATLPLWFGFGMRMLVKKYPFQDALAECKPHIVMTAICLLIIVIHLIKGVFA